MLVVSKGMPGVTLYNADTGEVICKSEKMSPSPHEVAFSPNGQRIDRARLWQHLAGYAGHQ